MSRLSGVALVLAGLGVAAYTLPSSDNTASVAGGPPRPPAQGAPQSDAAVVAAALEAAGSPESKAGDPPRQTVAEAAQAPAQAAQPPPAKIVPPPSPTPVTLAPPRVPVSQPTAASGPVLDRAGLSREIQRHLKRVGCYAGDINGVWTPAVRRAMKAFTERVNATLPLEEPDYILLAMVQNHQDTACGQGCPAGESLADDGRCLPKGIVAAGTKKRAVPDTPADAKATATGAGPAAPIGDPVPPPQGRMSLAGPQAAEDASTAAAPALRNGHKAAHRGTPSRRPVDYTYAGTRDRPGGGTSNRRPNWAAAAFRAQP